MNDEWAEVSLQDLVSLRPGKYVAKSEYVDDGKYWIYGSNSVMGRYNKALVHEPHVVMAAIGANAGAVRYSVDPSWVNNNAFALIPTEDVDAFFLYLWLASSLEPSQILAGTGQPYVKRPDLLAQSIALPPLAVQRRIVDLMSHLDNHLANLRAEQEGLDSLWLSSLQGEFNAGNSGESDFVTLGELVTIRTGKLDVNQGSQSGKFPFFTCSRTIHRIDTAAFVGPSVIVAGNGDLNVRYFDGEFNAYQRTYVLQPKPQSGVLIKYVYLFLETYVKTLRENSSGSVIKYIKLPDLRDATITRRDVQHQEAYVDHMWTLASGRSALTRELAALECLRSAILTSLLSGESTIPAEYDALLAGVA